MLSAASRTRADTHFTVDPQGGNNTFTAVFDTQIGERITASSSAIGCSLTVDEARQEAIEIDPLWWGLDARAVADLGQRLHRVWVRFRDCFRTRTRDTSTYAWTYLRGLLTMPQQRNYANISRRVVDLDDDGQGLQQFMSDSPWSSQPVFERIQAEIGQRPELHGESSRID